MNTSLDVVQKFGGLDRFTEAQLHVLIRQALSRACGNRTHAAKFLGVERTRLQMWLRRWPGLSESYPAQRGRAAA